MSTSNIIMSIRRRSIHHSSLDLHS